MTLSKRSVPGTQQRPHHGTSSLAAGTRIPLPGLPTHRKRNLEDKKKLVQELARRKSLMRQLRATTTFALTGCLALPFTHALIPFFVHSRGISRPKVSYLPSRNLPGARVNGKPRKGGMKSLEMLYFSRTCETGHASKPAIFTILKP